MKDVQTWLSEALGSVAPDRHKVEFRTDARGVATAWCRLDDPADLYAVARLLAARAARLSAISSFPGQADGHEIAYHFDLDGNNLTVTLELPAGQAVARLTPLFPAADWPEREMAQLDGVNLAGYPPPKALYVTEAAAVPVGYRPFSAMMARRQG